jgi:hypothetical protein
MNYSQHIHGTGSTTENTTEDQIDGKVIGLDWRLYTYLPARRSLRYDKAQRAMFAFAWADRLVEASRHRGALNMLA